MKEKPYMSSGDILEWVKLAVLAGEAELAAKQTKQNAKTAKEKDWAKRMQIAATHLSKVTDERLRCLDEEQLKTVQRRWQHSDVRLYTVDQLRMDKFKPAAEDRTITYQDFCFIGELALLHCEMCPQGEYVKDCEYRNVFHRIGIPVGRESVKEGECEFCTDNHMHIILPQGNTEKYHLVRQMVQEYYKNAELADEVKKNYENDKRLFL